ncbi:cytochrome c556 [Aminobacter niigataensis]|uniref:Cytochrome c556 n=1 Tax=Aminobacter niigataensis TaxID=83265 RepID=A0ABR6L9D4_9HYPH|nr:cytochrome c [Aminobacter niigataensis]MBB4653427.1 cytochrome c556 [Aminobacter niigataensis]
MQNYRMITLAVTVLATEAAVAHEGAMGIVAERMTVMKGMAANLKTVGEMLNGRKAFDAAAAQAGIAALHENCHQAQAQFSSATAVHSSRSSAAVWEKPNEFKAAMETFDAAVKALVAASEAGNLDDMRVPFKAVGQSCSSCHERFRLSQ